jgi:hypothetical protein
MSILSGRLFITIFMSTNIRICMVYIDGFIGIASGFVGYLVVVMKCLSQSVNMTNQYC